MKPTAALSRVVPLLCWAAACLSPGAIGQTIRVVTETTPYSFQRDSRVGGVGTDVVERTLQRAGLTDFRVALYPWARSYGLALEEPNVLIYPMARTPEREARFHWVGELVKREYRFYALSDRPEIKAAGLDEARRLSIGVVRDDVRHQYLLQRNFPRLVVSADTGENFRKLLNRQVDVVPLSDAAAQMQCEQARPQCTGLVRVLTLDEIPAGFYLAYSLQTPEPVVQRTRAAFDALRADGTISKLMGALDAPAPASAPPTRPVR